MDFESRARVSEEDYIMMIRLKTALLLGFSLELGAVLADASPQARTALRNAGIDLGIAFQLKDDLLDVYGSKRTFGKQVGGDIISNKKTFLLIKATQLARGKQKKELARWLSARKFDKKKKVTAIKGIYDSLSIKELTEQKIGEFFERGIAGIEAMHGAAGLISFARTLAQRQQ
jgi:geranylgeranyl diphosphate synthase type II